MLLFLTTANEAIMSLPVVVVLHHQMHRTLSVGDRRSVFGRALTRKVCGPARQMQT